MISGFKLRPEPGVYTVEQVDNVTPSNEQKIMSPRVTTTWTFQSKRPNGSYELQPFVYACPRTTAPSSR